MNTLLDDLLEEQQRLTAVERFARHQDTGTLPAQARYYRSLIPLTRPAEGEQYAFAVDLDLCTSCKGCVSACHSLNGLDDEEIWRNVGLIHGGTAEAPYQQTVTTACHHCVDPGCMNGCPVGAYEKDRATGIVRHLDDQCIGCQYCLLKCPYDVPKYSASRGIVRKCDMCYHRLAVDEAPACVQACPTSAISIRIVSKAQILAATEPGDHMVPGAFDSDYTKPTTSYTTRKTVPANARPGDAHTLRLDHAHWPLVWMLVLTQAAAGLFTAAALGGGGRVPPTLAFAILQAGLVVSVFHLGRPFGAWRFFLGLRTSWMSREILAFSLFAGAGSAFVAAVWWPLLAPHGPAFLPPALPVRLIGASTALLGAVGIWCSAMIYIDTQRPFWRRALTLPKFFGTALVLGTGAFGALWLAVPALVLLTGWELWTLRESSMSVLIQRRLLRGVWAARLALVVLAVVLAPLVPWAFVVLAAAAQVTERYCYFAAAHGPRMPGGVA